MGLAGLGLVPFSGRFAAGIMYQDASRASLNTQLKTTDYMKIRPRNSRNLI